MSDDNILTFPENMEIRRLRKENAHLRETVKEMEATIETITTLSSDTVARATDSLKKANKLHRHARILLGVSIVAALFNVAGLLFDLWW